MNSWYWPYTTFSYSKIGCTNVLYSVINDVLSRVLTLINQWKNIILLAFLATCTISTWNFSWLSFFFVCLLCGLIIKLLVLPKCIDSHFKMLQDSSYLPDRVLRSSKSDWSQRDKCVYFAFIFPYFSFWQFIFSDLLCSRFCLKLQYFAQW